MELLGELCNAVLCQICMTTCVKSCLTLRFTLLPSDAEGPGPCSGKPSGCPSSACGACCSSAVTSASASTADLSLLARCLSSLPSLCLRLGPCSLPRRAPDCRDRGLTSLSLASALCRASALCTAAAALTNRSALDLGSGIPGAAAEEAGAMEAAGARFTPGANRLGPFWACQVGRVLEDGSQEMSEDLLRSRSLLRSRVAILQSEGAGLSRLQRHRCWMLLLGF